MLAKNGIRNFARRLRVKSTMRLFIRPMRPARASAMVLQRHALYSSSAMEPAALERLLRDAGCSDTEVSGWGKEMRDWPAHNIDIFGWLAS